jgi:hypothetical protein
MTRLTFLVAITCLSIAACRPRYIEPAPNGAVISNARLGLYTKVVIAKKDPDTLIADDATICRVPPDRFRSTGVNTLVYCNWQ